MPRYIDADALKDVIQQHDYPLADKLNSVDNGMFTLGIFQAIDQMPTVSPDEARGVGKWEKETICYSRCSNCKKLIKTAELVEYKASDGQGDFLVVPSIEKYDCNYCSNCGAKMEVE